MVNAKAVAERIAGIVKPELSMMGYDLVDLEFSGSHLRLVIDKPGGVSMDDCVAVNRRVGMLLDVEDPIEGSYTLEVSSPGLTRRLRHPEEFDHFSGRLVRIQTKSDVIKGVLRGRTPRGVSVEVDGEMVVVSEDDIVRANLDF